MHHFRTLKEIESQSSDQQQAADEASSTAEAAEQTRQQERAAAEARRHAAAQEQAHSRERRRRQERAAAEARRHAAAQEQAHSRERGRRQERDADEASSSAATQEQARRQERAAEEPRSPVAAAETDQDKPPDKQRIFYLETLDAFELLESQGKLTPEESARLKTMRLTRSDYLDMAHRKLSGNPDATDNEIRDLSEWLFCDRDPDGYQKYKTDQVLTEARRLYEEAGLRDAQDIGDLRAYAPSRAERGHKTLARDVLQGVGLLSDDPDEAHKQVEEWGRYIWSVLSPMGFNRDYHLAQAEHDKLREGLAWRVATAGDKIVEVETEDGGKAYVLQSDLDAQERYERELAAFRQQREPLENLSRLMAQGGDELVFTDQGYLPRSAIEAQEYLATRARATCRARRSRPSSGWETRSGSWRRQTTSWSSRTRATSRARSSRPSSGWETRPGSWRRQTTSWSSRTRATSHARQLRSRSIWPLRPGSQRFRATSWSCFPTALAFFKATSKRCRTTSSNRRVSTGTSC